MLTSYEAIEQLVAAGVHKVDLNNDQPHCPKISLADTLEARAAELISHYQRRTQELLEANDRYLERARRAEQTVAQMAPLNNKLPQHLSDEEIAMRSNLADLLNEYEATESGLRQRVKHLAMREAELVEKLNRRDDYLTRIIALRGYTGENLGRVAGYAVAADLAERGMCNP